VLTRPPFSPYDTFIVTNNGITVGSDVYVRGVLIGYVEDVYMYTARVRLLSSPDTNTVVRIGTVDAEAVGHGGGRYRISLPKDVPVAAGDVVVAPDRGYQLLGTVSAIDDSEAGSFKTVHIALPTSLSDITTVTIAPNQYVVE